LLFVAQNFERQQIKVNCFWWMSGKKSSSLSIHYGAHFVGTISAHPSLYKPSDLDWGSGIVTCIGQLSLLSTVLGKNH
jgi:hypothetical protein